MSARHDLALVIAMDYEAPNKLYDYEMERLAETILTAGYRKIFDGDCGLSGVKDPDDREAAEAWMRFSNIVLGNGHDGIAAMKQMLTELGYRKVQP